MNFLKITASIILFSILFSCSSATEEKTETNTTISSSGSSSIIGEWFGTHWEVGGSGTMAEDEIPMTVNFTMTAKNLEEEKYSITFNKDNTVTSVSNNFIVHMKSDMAGMEFDQEIETGFSLDNARWELNGDILNITLSDEPGIVHPYKIVKLTKNELSIELDHLPDSLIEDLDESTQFTGYVKMRMIR